MRKINISKEQVEKIVTGGCKIAFGILAIAVPYLAREGKTGTAVIDCAGETKYSDAVSAILNSDLFDSNKRTALELLKRHEDADYYKSVISTIESDMFDSNKIQTIKILSEK